ncbi:MAG: hypothetical protein ACTS3F_14245 [Phycisphaerales bacterium]
MARHERRSRTPEVWFAIPSASVDRCRDRLPAWRDMGYKIAILQNRERGAIPADLVVWSDTYPGWGESVNILCREIVPASADIVVSGGDDMLPDPNKTAAQLAGEYFERFPDGFGVMQPAGDTFMWAANYCGSPWFARPFFTSMYGGRGPMWGGYRHNWADYELYWVARCLGVLWMRDDAEQRHAHFSRDNERPPEWWVKNVAEHDQKDCELFLARKYRGFPGHEPTGRDTAFDMGELLAHESGIAEWRWNASYAPHATATSPQQKVADALKDCADRGLGGVAIYGGGTHTRRAAAALASPAVTIRAIIDDNPANQGGTLWGYPVMSLADAVATGIDAIVLSSDSFEDALWTNTDGARARGIEVIRLYERTPTAAQEAA